MPTAQAPQTAGGPLRVGVSLTAKLALDLPHLVADEANVIPAMPRHCQSELTTTRPKVDDGLRIKHVDPFPA